MSASRRESPWRGCGRGGAKGGTVSSFHAFRGHGISIARILGIKKGGHAESKGSGWEELNVTW